MKRKKPNFRKLMKEIEEANKDSKFVESVRQFIRYHGGIPSN